MTIKALNFQKPLFYSQILTIEPFYFFIYFLGNDTWHKPNAWEFLVNKKYHIIWLVNSNLYICMYSMYNNIKIHNHRCNVFKAASSSWMFNFNVLAGYSPEFLQRTKEVFLNLARERYPRVSIEQVWVT